VHQEVEEYLEIILTRPYEFSLAYPLSGQFLRIVVEWTKTHTEQKDDVEEKQDIHHDYCVIQVQLRLQGLDYSGKEDTETVDGGVLVYPTQKFIRERRLLSCQDSDEYRGVEIDADLGSWSPNEHYEIDLKRGWRRLTPIPAMSGFELMH
jgi:hypothetical protein